MRGIRLLGNILGLALLAASMAVPALSAYPQTGRIPAQIRPQATLPSAAAEPIDVVVVLDDSGSMATCWPWPESGQPFFPPCQWPSPNPPSDPAELRYSAARLLIQLADDRDRVAVIRFDNLAEGIGGLGTLQEVGGPDNRRRLIDFLSPPASYLTRGYTRIDLALEQAVRLLEGVREPDRNQYILLLTDGEPTQPSQAGNQQARVAGHLQQLQEAGVLTFPVVLCNSTSGCAGDFLRRNFVQTEVREATSAQALLQVFSEVLAAMKADRSVVTNLGANSQFTTRVAQGVRRVTFVSPRAGLDGIRLDDAPILPYTALSDGNVEVNIVDPDTSPEGRWVAETADQGAFVVIQADSYPELVFPPPSAANSPASLRYYPAGKLPLLVAQGAGPAAGETLLLDGQTPLRPLAQNTGGLGDLRAVQLAAETPTVSLQLGDDPAPLQLTRTFRLEGRADLPRAEVLTPRPQEQGLLNDGRVRLQVGLGPGLDVQGLAATVYVTDETGDEEGQGRPVYQAGLNCVDRMCSDDGFAPGDGRAYQVHYLVTAQADGIRFGDWAQADLIMDPAVFLRGLPASLDLTQMPADGWPVSVVAGTTDEIGTLQATLELWRADSGESVPEAGIDFVVDVPESGNREARLRVDGLDLLRPGEYAGEIRLAVTTPSGLPMEVKIRPAPVLPVTLRVSRSAARLEVQTADFGEVPFETSPNFRLDRELLLPLTFDGPRQFRLTAELVGSTCSSLRVATGDLQPEGDSFRLPLHLQSLEPIQPGTCTGAIRLQGPSADFDVFPSQIDFFLRVADLEWSVVSSGLEFGNLGRAGERATATLILRFQGATPFRLQMVDVNVAGADGEGSAATLGANALEMLPVEVTGAPDASGEYQVPITLVARRTLPNDPLQGTFYSGDLALGIAGLEGRTRTIGVTFRSPTPVQRYIEPWLVPIYSLPWVICTGPLTLLLLLIAVARFRSRGYLDEPEPEPTIVLPQPEPGIAFVQPAAEDRPAAGTSPTGPDVTWGSQWGEVAWGSGREENPQPASPVAENGHGRQNPWDVSW